MSFKFIDIHSHVNFSAFDADRDAVMARAKESGTLVFNVGTQFDTSKKAVEMANQYEHAYAVIGLHPIHTSASYHDTEELGEGNKEFTSRGEIFDKDAYRELLKNPKVVAIGECGLDYYRCDLESIARQKVAFQAQVELASEFKKPLMLHIRNNPKDKSRNAYFDVIDILKNFSPTSEVGEAPRGDVHFFAGGLEEAQAFLDLGFTLSFTGVITFTKDYDEVIKMVPLGRIMVETDAPYVSPVPYRGKRNEPVYVSEVVKKIADLKGVSLDVAAEAIMQNAKRVFGI